MKDEKLNYFGGSQKNPNFRGGVHEKQYRGGECLKSWGLNSRCKEGGLGKTEVGGVFEGGLIPQCTL